MNPIAFHLGLGAALFLLGAAGVCVRRNALVMLMCIELMLNGANLSLVAAARHLGDLHGQAVVLFVLAVAAAEAAVGLAIILAVFRNYRSIRVDEVHDLHG